MSKWQQWEEQQCIWDRREHTFCFQMPPGITKASMEFSGIPGHYQFDFDTAQCTGSFVGWGEYDYDYESERFQMEREFTRCHRTRPSHYQSPVSASKSQIRKL